MQQHSLIHSFFTASAISQAIDIFLNITFRHRHRAATVVGLP